MTRASTWLWTAATLTIGCWTVIFLLAGCRAPGPPRSASSAISPSVAASSDSAHKFEPALRQRLLFASSDEHIAVTILVATGQTRTEPELFEELGRLYPEAQDALERTGNLCDVEDAELGREIEAAFARLVEEDRRAQTGALRAYLDFLVSDWQDGAMASAVSALLTPEQIYSVAGRTSAPSS